MAGGVDGHAGDVADPVDGSHVIKLGRAGDNPPQQGVNPCPATHYRRLIWTSYVK